MDRTHFLDYTFLNFNFILETFIGTLWLEKETQIHGFPATSSTQARNEVKALL